MRGATTGRRAWLSLAVLAGSFGVVSISISVMNVAFDAVSDEFASTSAATISWVITGYTTMTAALLLAAGRIADAYGRRRTFLAGIAVYTVSSLLGAVAWGPGALIAARVGQGAGAALVTPTSLALILTVFDASRRSTVVGVWGSVGAIAAAGGPALGGLIVDTLGWRWIFWLNIPLCLLVWPAAKAWIDESWVDDADGVPDPLGLLVSAAAVGALALGLSQSGEWGWDDPRTIAALVAGPLLGGVLVARSVRHTVPVLDLALFRLRSFTLSNVVTLVFMTAFAAMVLNNVLFLQRVWGYSAAGAGLGITPSPIMAAIVANIAGRAADRVGTRAMIVPGAALFTVGMLLLTFGVGTEPAYWSRWFPAALCFGSGIGMVFTNLASVAVADVPERRLAIASGVNGTARAIGMALGPAFVIGTVGAATGVGAAGRFESVWITAAAIGVVSLLIAWQLPRVDVVASRP